jgi:hypothetical protein
LKTGRPAEHDKLIYAGEGIWDIWEGKFQEWQRNWLWKSEMGLPKVPEKATPSPRFVAVYTECTNETEAEREVSKVFKNTQFKQSDEYTIVRVE